MHGRIPAVVLAAVTICTLFLGLSSQADPSEDLDRLRLRGKAYYENDKYVEAASEFQQCIRLAPESAVDHFNLGLVLMRGQDYEMALEALSSAEEHDPDLLAVHYIRGIIFKRQGRFEEAVESLKRVIAGNPVSSGTYYNLGVCLKAVKKYEEAVEAFKKKAELTPSDPSTHYQLISLYRRLGDVENAERHKEIFARIKDTVDESEKTVEALERSEYSYIIEAKAVGGDLTPMPLSGARFIDVTTEARLVADAATRGGAIALGDIDNDHDLDLYLANSWSDATASANRLYVNNGDGTFVDATSTAGVADTGRGVAAIFGDFDNDGFTDLYVVNDGPNVLYRNAGEGAFENVSESARVDEPSFGRKALFLDYDHDNDLDILVCNGFPEPVWDEDDSHTTTGLANTLLRNRGNGTFTDHTDMAGLLVSFNLTPDAVCGDFDGDNDIDLFVVNSDASPQLFENKRFGRYEIRRALAPEMAQGATAAAQGDFDHDGDADLVIGVGDELWLYVNDGNAVFEGSEIELSDRVKGRGIYRIATPDCNNDGWTDLFLVSGSEQPLSLLIATGPCSFADRSEEAGLNGTYGVISDLAVGDLNGDGLEDIVLQTWKSGPIVLRREGDETGHWLHVHLIGKKVNRSGYGAVVEIASGGHYQRQTYNEGGIHFGLGNLESVDVVRVTWPNGVAQNVIDPPIDGRLEIEEYVKVSASCGFLYTYNGRGFELVNEILGIGPLGVPMAPGVYHQPDCTELTKIESDQLAPRNGFYEIRLTEELRETMYADQFTLRVVDHPEELEIVPNEKFVAPPFPEDRLFAVADHIEPQAAVDDRGADVLDLVLERDGRVPTFPLTIYDGLAEQHSLTLDFGELPQAEQIMLYLDGWIYWSESSTVMAVSQDPRFEFTPLTLEVRDSEGQWHIAIPSVGLPTSKGLVVPVDMTGKFQSEDRQVRLSTNMCVYFDRIFVSIKDEINRCQVSEFPVASADLHYRGFSAMTRNRLGYERFDYADLSPTGSWNPPEGMLTRFGDVKELLTDIDDKYVIFGPGDELTLLFDAASLPELPDGWTRDYVFYANGWVKDGDLNTKFSETVEPLPFHGMSGYPYPESEGYPETAELDQYRRTYNNRPARPTVGLLPSGGR